MSGHGRGMAGLPGLTARESRKKGQELEQKNIERKHQKCKRRSAQKSVRSSRHHPPSVATRT